MILFLWPHCSCPNGLVTSNMAPAHPHATSIAVYPALFVVFLLLLFSNFFVMVFDCFLFGGGWGNIDQLKLEVEYQTNHTPYIHYLTMLPSAQNFGSISTSHRFNFIFYDHWHWLNVSFWLTLLIFRSKIREKKISLLSNWNGFFSHVLFFYQNVLAPSHGSIGDSIELNLSLRSKS